MLQVCLPSTVLRQTERSVTAVPPRDAVEEEVVDVLQLVVQAYAEHEEDLPIEGGAEDEGWSDDEATE